ncbi:MAG: HigA family addiction module antitoxin [Proteobacteria bacterium]|nr:HigA family addiction module antitoxin [Pseudomonadota bacterium]
MRIKTLPGEILNEEFLVPLGMSASALARHIGVPPNRITGIINGTRSVSPDTAVRLGLAFDTTPQFWLNLQQNYDLSMTLSASGHRSIKPIIEAV